MKLTANQIAALQEINSGAVKKINCGSCAWRIVSKVYPTIIGRLQSKGMIKWRREGDEDIACLTDSGKQALAEIVSFQQTGVK